MLRTGGEVEQRIDSIDGVVISIDPARTEQTIRKLERERFVEFVEPNYVLRATRLPNDHDFTEQWGLRNLGHFDGKVGADISAPAAWDVNRGSAWGAKGDLDRAIADFDEAVRLDPKDAQAYYNRGTAWEKKRRLREALADFKMHSQLAPSNPDGRKAVERVSKELRAR